MKTVISIKKHRSSLSRAIHKQKREKRIAVNRKEQEMTSTNKFKRFFDELWLAVEKQQRSKHGTR